VLQTLLNDLPILAIAYDNARPGDFPDTWEMRKILSISTFLGIMGVLFSFGLLYIGLEVLHLNLAQIQTFIFLKLATAGYLDIFMGRTRGFFWSLKPGWLLVTSGVLTRILATAMAIFGWFMAPITWQFALLVWGSAILELLVTDPLKVYVYRILDHRGLVFHR
jgi:H+-transporting ATPase